MSSSAMIRMGMVRSHARSSIVLPQSRGVRVGSWPSSLRPAAGPKSVQYQSCSLKQKNIDGQKQPFACERQFFLSVQWESKFIHTTTSVKAPKNKGKNRGSEDGVAIPDESKYYIDPITNRKVLRSESPSKSAEFLGHVAGFSKMAPPDNTNSSSSETPSAAKKPSLSEDIEDGNVFFDHDKNITYSPYRADEPDGKYKPLQSTSSLNPGLEEYDRDHDYHEGVRAHEPDGMYKVLQATKERPDDWTEFDEKTTYGAFRSHEPDGMYKVLQATKERPEAWTEFDQKTAYDRAFRSHEPDGMYKMMQTEVPIIPGLSDHDSKIAYEAFRAHEPDGKYKDMQTKMPVIPGLSDHDSKIAYEAVRAYEPDGKYKALQDQRSSVDGLEDHDKVAVYDEPFRAHEPDGKYQSNRSQKFPVRYSTRAYMPGLGDIESHRKEKEAQKHSKSKGYAPTYGDFDAKHDYSRPVRSHEPDGKYKKSRTTEKSRRGLDEYERGQDYAKPIRAQEPDGLYKTLHSTQPEHVGLEEFEKKHAGYDKPVRAHEPDGLYKPLQSSQSAQDQLDYDLDHAYDEGVRAHEPDGMYKPLQTSQPLQDDLDYDREHEYTEGVRAHEPDGMYKPLQASETFREGLSDFEKDHPGYDKPVRAHEPDGMYKVLQTANGREKDFAFDSKQSYGPVLSDEPDGKYKKNQYVNVFPCPVSGGLGSRLWPQARPDHEGSCGPSSFGRGGRVPPALVDKGRPIESSLSCSATRFKLSKFDLDDTDKFEDLDLLRASDIRARSGILKGPRKETDVEKAEKRKILTADYESTPLMDEVTSVKPDSTTSIDEHSNGVDPGEKKISPRKVTGNFVRDFPEEFSTTWTAKSNGALLPNLEGTGDDANLETPFPDIDQSNEQKIDRKILTNDPNSRNGFALRIQPSMDRHQTGAANQAGDRSEKNTATAADPSKKEQILDHPSFRIRSPLSSENARGQTFMPEAEAKFEAQKEKQRKHSEEVELVRKLRGIYEDTYGTLDSNHRQPSLSQAPSNESGSNVVKCYEKSQDLQEQNDLTKKKEFRFVDVEEKLQEEMREGQYFINDCYMEIAKIHARRASKVDSNSETLPANASVSASKSPTTSYKILAYDPIMQTINTASTTSIVPDTNPTLTPAEVLLRLSNPSKFFPHFAPLEAEGYEIVSGSGDVLVFRKVRHASPCLLRPSMGSEEAIQGAHDQGFRTNPVVSSKEHAQGIDSQDSHGQSSRANPIDGYTKHPRGAHVHSSTRMEHGPNYGQGIYGQGFGFTEHAQGVHVRGTGRMEHSPVHGSGVRTNPIDGTQGTPQPTTGNFASPTGFVNHDLHGTGESEGQTPFVSGLRMRREEPVFSGKSSWTNKKRTKGGRKMVLKRILFSAGFLAACTYAAGVVIEFFRSGGSDGLGAVGF